MCTGPKGLIVALAPLLLAGCLRAGAGGSSPSEAGADLSPDAAHGPWTRLTISGFPQHTGVGIPESITVTATDDEGCTVPTFKGLVTFSSSDAAALLPAPRRFVAGDYGSCTFTDAVVLLTAGVQTVEVKSGAVTASRQIQVAGGQSPTWYDPAWGFRRRIAVDHGKVVDGLVHFPLLVHLPNDPDLAAHARSDGADILFTLDDHPYVLSHEIERLDATGDLVAWVRVPFLYPTQDTALYLYYGNPAPATVSPGSKVWDDDFEAVWHLSESVADDGIHPDATSNGHDAALDDAFQLSDTKVSGQIGGGDRLKGKPGYGDPVFIHTPDKSLLSATRTGLTIEAWVRPDVPGVNQTIYGGGHGYGSNAGADLMLTSAGRIRFAAGPGTSFFKILISEQGYTVGQFQHVAATWDGTTMRIYHNGVADSDSAKFSGPIVYVWGKGAYLGDLYGGGDYNLNGVIDEVRVSSVARSAAWIATAYANQASPGTFLKVGAEEAAP